MIQHYIEYLSAGIIMSDSSSVKSNHRDYFKVKESNTSFGFRFYDQEEVQTEQDLLTGEKKNVSPWHYWGKVFTKQEVFDKFGEDAIVSKNMECNDIERVVETKHGQMIPMEKEDILL